MYHLLPEDAAGVPALPLSAAAGVGLLRTDPGDQAGHAHQQQPRPPSCHPRAAGIFELTTNLTLSRFQAPQPQSVNWNMAVTPAVTVLTLLLISGSQYHSVGVTGNVSLLLSSVEECLETECGV